MPQEIIELESKASEAAAKNLDMGSIVKNLRNFYPSWLQVSRYKPIATGLLRVTVSGLGFGGKSISETRDSQEKDKDTPKTRSGGEGGLGGSLYEIFQTPTGTPATRVDAMQLPRINWVSRKDGTRADNDGLPL